MKITTIVPFVLFIGLALSESLPKFEHGLLSAEQPQNNEYPVLVQNRRFVKRDNSTITSTTSTSSTSTSTSTEDLTSTVTEEETSTSTVRPTTSPVTLTITDDDGEPSIVTSYTIVYPTEEPTVKDPPTETTDSAPGLATSGAQIMVPGGLFTTVCVLIFSSAFF